MNEWINKYQIVVSALKQSKWGKGVGSFRGWSAILKWVDIDTSLRR